jgi:hypothetical protein
MVQEREETAYEVIERDARSIGTDKAPTIILKEIGIYAERNGAPIFGGAIYETLVLINRQASRTSKIKNDLKALLYALGARPLFGGPHLDLETAIARAVATLDGDGTSHG